MHQAIQKEVAVLKSVMGIIPAAGQGLRMGSYTKKPYLKIGGRTILAHTLDVFEGCLALKGYVVVVEPSEMQSCRELMSGKGSELERLVDVVAGGETRQESVYRGLMALDDNTEAVLIHDAARPCVESTALEVLARGCDQCDAVISATPSTDTMKIIRGGLVESTPNRSTLWRAQTPQTFRYRVLRAAHERAQDEDYIGTDDAELVERAGYVVRVIEGSPENIKVTTVEDLDLAERILRRQGRI